MPRRFAKTLFDRSVRASTGKAGLPGAVAGAAFNLLLRRSPVGAVALGTAILVHRAWRTGQSVKARRAARAEGRAEGGAKLPPPKA